MVSLVVCLFLDSAQLLIVISLCLSVFSRSFSLLLSLAVIIPRRSSLCLPVSTFLFFFFFRCSLLPHPSPPAFVSSSFAIMSAPDCTPFCDPSCAGDHHPILKALIRCPEKELTADHSTELKEFETCFDHCVQSGGAGGWQKNMEIPEADERFR